MTAHRAQTDHRHDAREGGPRADPREGISLRGRIEVLGREFPAAVYISVIAAFAWVLLASWLAFGSNADADLDLGIATTLGVIFFALPLIIRRVAATRAATERTKLHTFLFSSVEIATGRLTGAEAWPQILIIPAALALAALLIGAVCAFVA